MSTLKALPTISFNLQDEVGRPQEELFKSLTCTPAKASGEFRTLGPRDSWEERRGALNAVVDYYFEGYELLDGIHLYSGHNPKRIGGSIGWVRSDKIQVIGNTGLLVLNKKARTVTLPHRRQNDGSYVLIPMTAWVTVKDYPSGLEAFNAPIDPKTFKNNGVIKHGYLEELRRGVRLTTEVTIHRYVDPKTGQVNLNDGSQRKAQWLERVLNPRDPNGEPLDFDYDAAREAWVKSNQEYAATQNALSVARSQETEEEHDSIIGTVVARANGQEPAAEHVIKGETWVNGVLTDVNKVNPGLYWPVNVNAKGEKVSNDGPAVRIYGAAGLSILVRASKNPRKGFVTA